MSSVQPDTRSAARREKDEQIAREAPLSPPTLSADAPALPLEAHRHEERKRPLAIPGIVENGVVRLTEPGIVLPENSRVIVVAESA